VIRRPRNVWPWKKEASAAEAPAMVEGASAAEAPAMVGGGISRRGTSHEAPVLGTRLSIEIKLSPNSGIFWESI